MDDLRFGASVRAIRVRRRWRQSDLADRAGVSQSTVSRIERGHLATLAIGAIRGVAAAIDMRVDLTGHWRAGDLDRLLNARHSALHEMVARMFGDQLPAWVLAPEVSFSVYGERGIIDIVAWHPGRRALLVIELKTDIVDVNELLGTLDRKRRLARHVAAERGWDPVTVSCWLIVGPGRTNRARIAAHRGVLRTALPIDGRSIGAWLRDPVGTVGALSIWQESHGRTRMAASGSIRRVRSSGATPA